MVICDRCLNIGRAIEASDTREATEEDKYFDEDNIIPLGTIREIQQKQDCETCRTIAHHFASQSPPEGVTLETDLRLRRFRAPPGFEDTLVFYIMAKGLKALPLHRNLPSRVGFDHAIKPDRQWIDISRLRSWIDSCDATHRSLCREAPARLKADESLAIILIDAVDQRLVETCKPGKYIALSYVWGHAPGFDWTTSANFRSFKGPDGLKEAQIPASIRDAMNLTRMLGERFLWADRFCVVQDDGEQKGRQIMNMHKIYSNAYLTVVAGSGSDCDYGLPGVGQGSRPREYVNKSMDFSPNCRMSIRDVHSRGNSCNDFDSTWDTRAWTFQEKQLSRRMLVFKNNVASWLCQQCAQSEDLSDKRTDIKFRGHYGRSAYLRWPQFDRWSDAVIEYQKRNLTYQSDTLNAFNAFLGALSFVFTNGFIQGMPRMFLDIALLWQPMKTVVRRPGFPSWSWAGWQGALHWKYSGWKSGDTYIKDNSRDQSTWETSSLVRWRIARQHSDEQQSISTSHDQYRNLVTDPSAALPRGWTRHAVECSSAQQPQTDRRYYFTHQDIDEIAFWYPIPIPQSTQPDLSPVDGWSPYLYFESSASWFRFGQLMSGAPDDDPLLNLTTGDGACWAGIIRLNMPQADAASLTGTSCELIAISTGRARNDADERGSLEEWALEERPKAGEYYEFYNVLWIEWEDGVAFRRALGRVVKGIWEAQGRKDISVKLG